MERLVDQKTNRAITDRNKVFEARLPSPAQEPDTAAQERVTGTSVAVLSWSVYAHFRILRSASQIFDDL